MTRQTLLFTSALLVFASACDPACPAGTVPAPTGACVFPDAGGVGDGAVAGDGALCPATAALESCNGVDDDCNGQIDDGNASSSCATVRHGSAGCLEGRCVASRCDPNYLDCNHEFDDGCEIDGDIDVRHCGMCGVTCGWDCASGSCDDATQIAVGGGVDHYFACARREQGDLVCWGANGAGQLGDGTTVDRANPRAIVGLSSVSSVSAGDVHTCALTASGEVWCWGGNRFGQVGNGTNVDVHVPVRVDVPTATSLVSLFAGTCALTASGQVWCWGSNTFGTLGNGTRNHSSVPVRVVGLPNAVSIGGGASTAYAVGIDGLAYAWGKGTSGELGNAFATDSAVPVRVAGLEHVERVVGMGEHACAKLADGQVHCWGANDRHQVSASGTNPVLTPARVPLAGCEVGAMGGTDRQSCASCADGQTKCWGTGFGAQPSALLGLERAMSLAASPSQACGVDGVGAVYCWVPDTLPSFAPVARPR